MLEIKDCEGCKKLEKEIEILKRELEELKALIKSGKRQAAPFGKSKFQREVKSPGRKKGEGNFNYLTPPEKLDKVEKADICSCSDCGNELTDKKSYENYEIEIPEIKPLVTKYITESGYCDKCRKRSYSRNDGQLSNSYGSAKVSWGASIKALSAEMKHRLGIPYRKIADFLGTLTGLKVSASGLCSSNHMLSKKAEKVYDQLIDALRVSTAVHSDETGWRIGTLSSWLWVFTNKEITVYTIRQSRGHNVVIDILGKEFKGVLHSDCFVAYNDKELNDWLKQKCLSHLIKEFSELTDKKKRASVKFAMSVKKILQRALKLRDEKQNLDINVFQRRLLQIEKDLDKQISESRQLSDKDNIRLAKRLRKHRQHIFRFLTTEDVEATNNRAERALRPAVIIRKTGGCNKTEKGSKTHAIISSVLVTAKQQGHNTIQYLKNIIKGESTPDLVPT